jgi:hypothetical protein
VDLSPTISGCAGSNPASTNIIPVEKGIDFAFQLKYIDNINNNYYSS